jgi:MerR family transcriptional regulator, light-induced transcriptional regulator
VYIRKKKVKGIDYAYLVRSIWDQTNKTSKQEIVKYLGKTSRVTQEIIPIEYRNDPSIVSFITRYSTVDVKKNDTLTKKLGQDLFTMLSAGDLQNLVKIYDKYVSLFGMIQFYDNLLKPVMYDIGQQWAEGKLDVATEHVCVNTATALIKNIDKSRFVRSANRHYKGAIFICTPNGEQHNLACNILESVLLSKGYRVYNASPSVPADSVINSLKNFIPDAILISITLTDHLQTTRNLIRKIRTQLPYLPIFLGGIAVNHPNKASEYNTACTYVIRNMVLADAIKLIRSTILQIQNNMIPHRKYPPV